jgi:methylenetetrahydrofolate--tRNA-(uracil-5-)-methyltransferase
MKNELIVIGGGLAGTEAAWQAAEQGLNVTLYEMRPHKTTPAHVTSDLAELVCSNSLGSMMPHKAGGLLKADLRGLGSLILRCAEAAAVPAGSSLAVDREGFAALVTRHITEHPRIQLVRREVTAVPDTPCIIATGPLTSDALAEEIGRLSGEEYLYFYDAVSPIVDAETIDMEIAFRASRYERGVGEDGDYINCPLNREEYDAFVAELAAAEQIVLRDFEHEDAAFFEGCLPVEVLARRSAAALRFGPLRPVGLTDPQTGRRPYAVVQLRQDNLAGTLYNLVGFQTNLRWPEQKRVLRLIPGLQRAQFLRYGMMHRNTYLNAPAMLQPTMQTRRRADLFFAGQIVGVEGYMGNAASGLVAGLNAGRLLQGGDPITFPAETMIGALCHYVTHAEARHFQPMKANFGLLPPPARRLGKSERYRCYAERALETMARFAGERGLDYDPAAAAPVPPPVALMQGPETFAPRST